MTDDNYWKHFEQEKNLSKNKYLNPSKIDTPQVVNTPSSHTSNDFNDSTFTLVKASTYAKGVELLKTPPLTFKENIEARIIEYERDKNIDGSTRTKDQKIELFKTWLDSCTGIEYQAETTKYKIITKCINLIAIKPTFNETFMQIDYSKIQGVELDSSNGLYSKNLSLSQILDHQGWLTAVENDKSLLKNYAEITLKILNKTEGLGFYVRKNTSTNELRALCVDSVDDSSDADGNDDLNVYARFLLVAPSQKNLQRK